MFDFTSLTWDPEKESYEDFLERAGPKMASALAGGEAFLAQPLDAVAHVVRFRDAHVNKDDSWKDWVAGIEDVEECGQAITELIALQHPVYAMVNELRKRARDIIKEKDPEEYERQTRERKAIDDAGAALGKALGDAMDSLRRALEEDDEDDEPWKN